MIPEFYAAELSKLAGYFIFCKLATARCISDASGWLCWFVGDKIDESLKICQIVASHALLYVGTGTRVT